MRAYLFACALALSACGAPSSEQSAAPNESQQAATAPIEVHDAWAAPTPGGVEVAAGYLTIVNGTDAADRLVAISSPRAERAEAHEMSMDNGVMRMRAVEGGLAVQPGQTVTLAPGGLHLMFYGVTQPFTVGESIPVTLTFERAGEVNANLDVRRPTTEAPAHDSRNGH